MSEKINHWAELLEPGDRIKATIRLEKDGWSDCIENADVIVVSTHPRQGIVKGWYNGKELLIKYNDVTKPSHLL